VGALNDEAERSLLGSNVVDDTGFSVDLKSALLDTDVGVGVDVGADDDGVDAADIVFAEGDLLFSG